MQVVVEQSAVSHADHEHVTALGQDTVVEVLERGHSVVVHLLRRGHPVEAVVTVADIFSMLVSCIICNRSKEIIARTIADERESQEDRSVECGVTSQSVNNSVLGIAHGA